MALQYLIALDFEATCGEKGPKEIIEFAAALINLNNGVIDPLFRKYVKPRDNPVLTDLCKKLTGIDQKEIDKGVRFEDCLSEFLDWSQKQAKKYNFVLPGGPNSTYTCALATWSNTDIETFLKDELKKRNMRSPPIFNQYVDLQAVFKERYGSPATLKDACDKLRGVFEGREHCGLDDAKNLAKLAYRMRQENLRFVVTRI